MKSCTWNLTVSGNGVFGYTVTGPNGNSILLPDAGFCVDSSATTIARFFYIGRLILLRLKNPHTIFQTIVSTLLTAAVVYLFALLQNSKYKITLMIINMVVQMRDNHYFN